MKKFFINLGKVIAGLASASAGVVKKGHEILEDTYYSAVGDREIAKLLAKIHDNNELHQTEYKKIKKEYKYIDSAVISGLFLPQMTGWFRFNQTKELTKEVFEAYELAYPNKAQEESFIDAWGGFTNPTERLGFINTIKGKLFETKYVKFLNENLEEGYHASLATSPTQKGWDIVIDGPDKELASYLQLKATNNINYVQETIKNNPEIDVVTLEDLQGQLLMTSSSIEYADISNQELLDQINNTEGFTGDTYLPPLIGLGWIVFDEFKKEQSFLYKSFKTGKRSTNLFANGTILALSGGLGGIPLIFLKDGLLNNGNTKKQKVKMLKQQIKQQENSINRVQKKVYTRREFLKSFAAAAIFAASPKRII